MNYIRQRATFIYKTADVIATLGLIGVWAYVFFLYPKLPDSIPLQFDADGHVSKRGPKGFFFILPVAASIVWINTYRLHRVQYFNYSFLRNGALPRIIAQLIVLLVTVFVIRLIYQAVA